LRAIFTFLLLAALAAGGWFYWALFVPVTPVERQFVLLHAGYSTRRIARELQADGLIRSAHAFVFWHALHRRRSLKAGEYLFEKSATGVDIHDRLARGDVYVHTVVVPEGYNMFEIAQAIQEAGLGPGRDFLNVATSDTELVADLAPDAETLEGFLFPSTYEFTRTQTMTEMAAAMVKQFREVAREVGLNADVLKTVTMASIVEKETGVPEERAIVASVYDNRLAKHIPLQADPSVIYAEQLQGDYSGALHHQDMQFKSAFNTYTHAGLPPGPIGNPGKSALEAAMHPATTDFYYFVSDGNGHHRFAHSLKEHNENVAAYKKAVQEQRH
jgi:UPF0755 protein